MYSWFEPNPPGIAWAGVCVNTCDLPVLRHLPGWGFLGIWEEELCSGQFDGGVVCPWHDLCHSSRSFCPAAIIEHVRDGSVVRALLLPDYYLVTVMLSGIKVSSYAGLRGGSWKCSVLGGLHTYHFFLVWAINIDWSTLNFAVVQFYLDQIRLF